jgi:hypothetical protein
MFTPAKQRSTSINLPDISHSMQQLPNNAPRNLEDNKQKLMSVTEKYKDASNRLSNTKMIIK